MTAGFLLGSGSPPGAGFALLERAMRATSGAVSNGSTATMVTTTVASAGGTFSVCEPSGTRTPTTAQVRSPPRSAFRSGGVLELHVTAKKGGKKRRRRPRPGRGGGGDDNYGGGYGGGGDWGDWGDEWEPEPDPSTSMDLMILWRLLCFFSLLQSLHFAACQSFPGLQNPPNPLAITHAVFGRAARRAPLAQGCA